jgi:hypothetical protein
MELLVQDFISVMMGTQLKQYLNLKHSRNLLYRCLLDFSLLLSNTSLEDMANNLLPFQDQKFLKD